MKKFIICAIVFATLISNTAKIFAIDDLPNIAVTPEDDTYKSTFDGVEYDVILMDPYAVNQVAYDYEGFYVDTTYKNTSSSSFSSFNQFLTSANQNTSYDFALVIKFPRALEAGRQFYFGTGLTANYINNFTKNSPYIQIFKDNTWLQNISSDKMILSYSNSKLYLSNSGYITTTKDSFNKIIIYFNGKTTSGYSTSPSLTFNYATVTTGDNEKLNQDEEQEEQVQTGLFESILNAVVGLPSFFIDMTPSTIGAKVDTFLLDNFNGLYSAIVNVPNTFNGLFSNVLNAFNIFKSEDSTFFVPLLNIIQWAMKGAFNTSATFFTSFQTVMTSIFGTTFGNAGVFFVNMTKLLKGSIIETFETDGNFFTILGNNLSTSFTTFFDEYGSFFTTLGLIFYDSIVGPITLYFDGWLSPIFADLFIPSENYLEDTFTSLYTNLRYKLGLLLIPLDVIIAFVDQYSQLSDTNGTIYIPNIKVFDTVLIKQQTYDLKKGIGDVIGNDLYNLYFAAMDTVLVLSFLRLATVKLNSILRRNDRL